MTSSSLQRIFRTAAQQSLSRSRAPWKAAVATLGLALGATSAVAAIADVNGDVVQIVPGPADVRLDGIQSDVNFFAFNEGGCVTLATDVFTDGGVILANTEVRSHFIHADPLTMLSLNGKVLFANLILGVISTTAELDATDVTLGRARTRYPTGIEGDRGLEPGDGYAIVGGGFGIDVTTVVPVASDQIRVLTSCP
jgi:hypothetical protein